MIKGCKQTQRVVYVECAAVISENTQDFQSEVCSQPTTCWNLFLDHPRLATWNLANRIICRTVNSYPTDSFFFFLSKLKISNYYPQCNFKLVLLLGSTIYFPYGRLFF